MSVIFKFLRSALCVLSGVILFAGCSAKPKEDFVKYKNTANAGVWITYSEIGSMLTNESGFEKCFEKAVERCRSVGADSIYIHVRSHCDALYKSEIFPLVKNAEKYDFDLLEYIINVCHKNGISVHAWINPYRVSSSGNADSLPKNSPALTWINKENCRNAVVLKEGGVYLNPAEDEVKKLIIGGVKEITENYDVDGIHFDDYFYPVTDAEFDKASYEEYSNSSQNPMSLADWRRNNVNSLISGVYSAIKYIKKEVVFSVSPAASLTDNYNNLYADVSYWVKNNFLDVIIPQLYFGYEYPDRNFKFDSLLKEWKEIASLNDNVDILIGLAAYKTGTSAEPDREEWNNCDDILARQAKDCRKDGRIKGYVLFSYGSVFSDAPLNAKQLENLKKIL